jgi:hypothetical protein
MSEKRFEIPSSEIYTISDADLPTSSEELKKFLIEINNSINGRDGSQNISKLNNEDDQINTLTFNDSRILIDQSVFNSVFSSYEKSKDETIENFKSRDIYDDSKVINLINIDQELLQNNINLKIIDNFSSTTNSKEEKIDKKISNEFKKSNNNDKKSEINLIRIDKDYMNSNDTGNITIIQNVPLLIINHNCCDIENCKLNDSINNVNHSEQNQDINDELLNEYNLTQMENLQEALLSQTVNNSEPSLTDNIQETSLSQIENKVETSLTENISNFQENTQDRSWSITSYHHYEEVITEEKIDEKSDNDSINVKNDTKSLLSQESSIHLADEHGPDINNKTESNSNNSDLNQIKNNKIESDTDEIKLSKNVSSLSDVSCSSNKRKSRKKKCCSETSTSTSSSSCKLETSLSQGSSKKNMSDSPLVESIDRIKHILSDLIKEIPKNQNKNRTCNDLNNTKKSNQTKNNNVPSFQSNPNEGKSSIRFVFPQINIPSNSLNNCQSNIPLSKNKTPKLNHEKSNKNKPCCPQKTQNLQQPVWVLTRVTKHVTRTIRKEVLPC